MAARRVRAARAPESKIREQITDFGEAMSFPGTQEENRAVARDALEMLLWHRVEKLEDQVRELALGLNSITSAKEALADMAKKTDAKREFTLKLWHVLVAGIAVLIGLGLGIGNRVWPVK
jgi:hypothetical protein